MSATDEQFAAAYIAYDSMPLKDAATEGRNMLAALEAHGCIPKPQGLNQRQQVTLQIVIAQIQTGQIESIPADDIADMILALGEPQ